MADTTPVVQWRFVSPEVTDPDAGWQSGLWMPIGKQTDSLVWAASRKAGVEEELRREFPETEPLWYGLWMNSPLSSVQCEILYRVFAEIEVYRHQRDGYIDFLNALDTGRQGKNAVEVFLQPPGHYDFNWLTIYPHCPRCHASARWADIASRQACANATAAGFERTCSICGTIYDPGETGSATHMDSPPVRTTVRQNIRMYFHLVYSLLAAIVLLPYKLLRPSSEEDLFRERYRLKKPSKRPRPRA